ncbi:MAG: (deoxy)nucleoside triphosphate pyrophosphohydrolase [Candidatus Omnitrophica bacterium]|nr:(deoxy)nucleoside triphosphate pyrophosphohydrolase [Candidatus Omnitrophota bacterium]
MGTLEVGCAIIRKAGRLLIAQRYPDDSYGGFWEFPGGKREANETMEECLAREVFEELGVRIRPEKSLRRQTIEARGRTIVLDFYFCDWNEGEPAALDCHDFRWITQTEIDMYRFLPGDLGVLEELKRQWETYVGSR